MAEIIKSALPRTTADAALYWEGLKLGELRYQVCSNCNEIVFHPRYVCPYCLSSDLRWEKSGGRGKVYSFSTLYRPPHESLRNKVPYTLALIELNEGFFMFSEVVDCDPALIKINMPVNIVFHEMNEEITLPKFKPI